MSEGACDRATREGGAQKRPEASEEKERPEASEGQGSQLAWLTEDMLKPSTRSGGMAERLK